jgi:hypothetical protein
MGHRNHPPAAVIITLTVIFTFAGCAPGDHPLAPAGVVSEAVLAVEPEQCIDEVLRCYAGHADPDAISRYAGILHPDYAFHFQPKDVTPGERPFLDREEDILVTGRIFASATFLFLDISPGTWFVLCDYEGLPCEGCFTTTRKYSIIARFGEGAKIHRGSEIVVIIAVPDPDFPERFVIRAMYDIDDD